MLQTAWGRSRRSTPASRTFYDWSHNNNTPDHADEAVRGLRDAALRAVFGYGNANDEWIPPSTLPTNFSDINDGFLATLKLIAVGVRPSLSIDIVTSIAGDMFGAMRMLLAGTRAVVNDAALRERRIVDPLPLMSRDVLEFATVQGARACGLEGKTGSLTPGKEADIVLIDTDSLNLMPMNNPVGIAVECAHAGNVGTVIVGGRIVKRDKRMLGVDLHEMRTRVDGARDALFRRADFPTDGSWLPPPL